MPLNKRHPLLCMQKFACTLHIKPTSCEEYMYQISEYQNMLKGSQHRIVYFAIMIINYLMCVRVIIIKFEFGELLSSLTLTLLATLRFESFCCTCVVAAIARKDDRSLGTRPQGTADSFGVHVAAFKLCSPVMQSCRKVRVVAGRILAWAESWHCLH